MKEILNRTKCKILVIIGLAGFLLPNFLIGQMTFGFSLDPNKLRNSYDEIEDLQIQVANKLRRYFDQNKFMVVVDVEERERQLPSTPLFSDALTVDTGLSIDYLPGLPFHPSIRKKSMEVIPKKSINGQLQKYYKHTIQVLMDTSYSQTALKFAEEVIRGGGLVNIKNGDEVFVEFQAFPNKYPGMETNPSLEPMPVAEDPEQKSPSIEEFENMLDKKLNKPTEAQEKDKKEGQWMMWIIIALVSLLLLLYIIQLLIAGSKRRKDTQNIERVGQTLESEKVNSLQSQIQKLTDTINKPLNNDLEIDELSNLAELKSYVTSVNRQHKVN